MQLSEGQCTLVANGGNTFSADKTCVKGIVLDESDFVKDPADPADGTDVLIDG